MRWCERNLGLSVAAQSRYDAATFKLILIVAAMRNVFLESALQASRTLGATGVPSPRGLLYRFRTWARDGRLERALVNLNHEVLREARKRHALPRRAVAAIDYTDTQYYGQKGRGACCRAPEKRGTTWFHRIATLSLVVRRARYTVAWVKVTPLTSHKAAVECLLDVASEWVDVRLVMMDRGLYGNAVKLELRRRGIKVLMAAPKNNREAKAVERCKGLNFRVEAWSVGEVEGWWLIVADNRWLRERLEDRRVDEGHSLWLTDLPVREDPLPYIKAYNRRWSIENAFQEEDRFQARTKCPEASMRFCLILLGVVLRNVWVLLKRGRSWLTTFLLREVLHDVAMRWLRGTGRSRLILRLEAGR